MRRAAQAQARAGRAQARAVRVQAQAQAALGHAMAQAQPIRRQVSARAPPHVVARVARRARRQPAPVQQPPAAQVPSPIHIHVHVHRRQNKKNLDFFPHFLIFDFK